MRLYLLASSKIIMTQKKKNPFIERISKNVCVNMLHKTARLSYFVLLDLYIKTQKNVMSVITKVVTFFKIENYLAILLNS